MADTVPIALKQADVNLYKTATRAAQLQTVKPIIAYWCEYWVVNQILARNFHSTDVDILNYTTNLMDKLEQTKNEYAGEDAVVDDVAAQAYVEQFAQETLDRAEKVIRANKVTLQTASTFDAALTFLNLVNIWGPPDTETQQKIKYAKWNAARITKAIKEGKDPNESNPKKEDLPPQQPALDLSEQEAQMLDMPSSQAPKSATVEDAPDEDLAGDRSLPTAPPGVAVSPIPPSVADDEELKLPSAPGYNGGEAAPDVPSGYFDPPPALPSPISPPSHNPVTYDPDSNVPPPAPDAWVPTPPPAGPSVPPTAPPVANVARPVVPPPTNYTQANAGPAAPSLSSQVPQQVTGNFTADDMAMSQAQKHAKWAISALNFEDVPTAVRELRRALEALGAT